MIAGENREFVGYIVRVMLALLIIIILTLPLLHYMAR